MLDAHALRRHWSTPGAAAAALAVAVTVAALGVMAWRISQGVDLNDEAFYLAIPARFAMGDRPFVDDLSVAQTAGLLLYPFLKAYVAIAGTTGIFLFVRVLYLLFFACVGWSAYALARPHVPRPAALLLATACCCYLPYSLPGLGYNTLSVGLLAIALFTNARWLLAEDAPRPFWRTPVYWTGVAVAAACFAYPTQLLSAAATVAALVALARGRRRRALAMSCAGGASFALLALPVLAAAGLTQLRAMVHYTSGDSPSSGFAPAVIAARLAGFAAIHPELPLTTGVALAAALAVRRLPRATALPMILFPLLCCGSALTGYLGSLGFVASLGMMGPLLALGVPAHRTALVLAAGVALPSMVAGLVWSLSSTNLQLAAGVGLFPGAIVAGLLLFLLVDGALARTAWARLRPALALSPAVLVVLLLHYAAGETTYYLDGPRHRLTARMTEGPYWGLSTTPTKAKLVADLTADLRAHRGGRDARIYCNIPAAYLIAERRPMVAAVWIFPAPSRLEIDAAFFLSRARPGELIIRGAEGNHVLDEMIAATSDLVVQREGYAVRIYRGFGKTVATAATGATLPFDEWRGLGTAESDPLVGYGLSWPEGWGRWTAGLHAGLILPRPEVPPAGTIVKLDLLAHRSRAVKRQRFKIRVDGALVAEGAVGADAVVELHVPASLAPDPTLYLTLELPDALRASDGRLLGLGLKRVMLSRAAGG